MTHDAADPKLIVEQDAGGFVLLVDDDADIREAVADLLREHGFRVVIANGGAQAITFMTEHATRLSLVLLDWNMPEVSGGDVIAWMAGDPRLVNLPVYAFTASPHLVTAKVPIIGKSDVDAVLQTVRQRCRPAE